jgi:GNAT superfamily N-acetyltransferase
MNDELLNELKNKHGVEITSVTEIENNEIFNTLTSRLKWYFSRSPLSSFVLYNTSKIATIVGTDEGYTLRHHECITFSLSDGSHIRFSPNDSDGIEITRVFVPKKSRRKGTGKMLMGTFFAFLLITLGFIPQITLECTGSIGLGESQESAPIENQIKFFKKFGFQEIYISEKNDYVKMEFCSGDDSIKSYLE